MNYLKKCVKWVGILIIGILALAVVSGFIFRWWGPQSSSPPGKLVTINGTNLHILAEGKKSDQPTVVIEAGGGLSVPFGYWLSEGLKNHVRVIRYDRAGLGYSDECKSPRDPETVAKELHELLIKAGESPPYLMMGHSIGGPYIRVFTELYPNEVVGMVFLDATHPDHIERYNAPKKTDFKYKGYLWTIRAQAILADMGILGVIDKLIGTPYYGPGLPKDVNARFKEVLYDGKSFRGYAKEMELYYDILERSGKVEDFGALPILAFNAVAEDPSQRELDSKKFDSLQRLGNHKEYAELSSNGKYIGIPGNHVSIFTKKENAAIICHEVLQLLETLAPKSKNGNY